MTSFIAVIRLRKDFKDFSKSFRMPDALLIFLRSALAVACSANKVSKAVYFVFISVKAAVSESAVIFVIFSGFLSL